MEEHQSVIRKEELSRGLNYDDLRLRGIAHAQQLSGATWTDYNVHDPGVTLLEYLCFALTDLSYRANFDIRDILYANDDQGKPDINNAFFPAHEILPTTPLTPHDYRRLLIDQVKDIRNAWFDPILNHQREYRGLFKVRIQLAEDIDRTLPREKVLASVRELLMAHRNLCEDLDDIVILKTEHIHFSAVIEIQPDAFGEMVIARILHTVEQKLNPGIRYYTKEELLAEGLSISEIFDGPEPVHGFIKPESLKKFPDNTNISELREEISAVEGVKLINDLKVWKEGQRITGDEIVPGQDAALSLDPSMIEGTGQLGELKLLRNGVSVSINPRQTRQFYNNLSAKGKKGFQLKLKLGEPPAVSHKKVRDLRSYYSLQRLLPAVYGLGAYGPPATANRSHRAYISQLKGYLIFFEQLMANYLAQLANVRHLFSIAEEKDPAGKTHEPSYFYQFPHDIPEGINLVNTTEENPSPEVIEELIQEVFGAFDPADERRGRFLDHLLARFGETYAGDYLKLLNHESREEITHQLLRGKAAYLRHYCEISRYRSRGFNYLKEAWENENVSGLKKRLALQLNLHDSLPGSQTPKYQNRFLGKNRYIDDLLGFREEKADGKQSRSRLSFGKIIRKGCQASNYDISGRGKNMRLTLKEQKLPGGGKSPFGTDGANADKAGKSQSSGADAGATITRGSKDNLEKVRDKLLRRFNDINLQGEGFFLLENILLRPRARPGSMLVFEMPLPIELGLESIELRTPHFTTEKELQDLSNELLLLGAQVKNWSLLETDEGWSIVLSKHQSPRLLSAPIRVGSTQREGSESPEQAQKILDFLHQTVTNLRDHNPPALQEYLRFEGERLPGHSVNSDFYSLRLSMVAPNWPVKFHERDFQQLFQQVVARNIPAHLSVDYYWLSVTDMREFEGHFKTWLEALKNEDDRQHQAASLQLIRILRGQQSDQSEGEKYQGFPRSLLERLTQRFGYGFLLSEDDLGLFICNRPQVVYLLKEEGIDTWQKLRRTSTSELEKLLIRKGEKIDPKEIAGWRRQAALALDGQWSDLQEYQEQFMASAEYGPSPRRPTAKVERKLRELAKSPDVLLDRIESWIARYPSSRSLPINLLDFLCGAAGYGFIIPENDLQILPGLTEQLRAGLQGQGITTRLLLSEMDESRWQSILNQFQITEGAPSFEEIHAYSTLAANGRREDWEQLLRVQRENHPDRTHSPLQDRLSYHLERLRKGTSEVTLEKTILTRLRDWRATESSWHITPKLLEILLSEGTDTIVFPVDDLTVVEGIGEKYADVLCSSGIEDLESLGAQRPASLYNQLRDKNLSVNVPQLTFWIDQAQLATDHQWQSLIDLQKHGETDLLQSARIETPLRRRIQAWLDANASSHSARSTRK
ncbi:hypothetical protein [Lewinella sp. W8]|uniref:hypothetical protein n=1 Tax=Lewinella sp. W8 TaxID=2528208 RepID=UPI001067C4D5|nr:hypothetical protein [Lewinella sp. W8]MTB52950.1 hypothetical protein [Lewinella sp. W8]